MPRTRWVFLVVGTIVVTAGVAGLADIASSSETVNYSYDAKGRLVKVEHSGTVNNGVVANYTLDKADNRKNVKVTGAP
ncbi:MAG: hypothetical protein V4564_20650 [Pseudomonadota bacterium]